MYKRQAYIIAAVMNSYLNVLRGAGDVNVSLVAGLFEMGDVYKRQGYAAGGAERPTPDITWRRKH